MIDRKVSQPIMEERGDVEEDGDIPERFARLLKTPKDLRESEDVFEIANGLFRSSFVRQLDVNTRCRHHVHSPGACKHTF